jgi:hypothetical protein
MGETSSTNEKDEKCIQQLARKSLKRRRHFGNVGSPFGPCERGNEPSSPIKEEGLDLLNNC